MRPEDRLRARCRMYLDVALPAPGFYTAIEHGRMHTGTPEQRAREWGRLKAQGVKTGLSDLMVWHVGKFIAPEAKVGKNDTSEAQDSFGNAMRANGFEHFVFRSVVELHDGLVARGVPIQSALRILAASHDACLATPEPARKGRASKPQVAKPKASTLARMHAARRETMF